jgi:DNA-binding CsgD family transcriptional regulator
MAAAQRRPAAQAEAVALLALEAARIGSANGNSALLETAATSAREARQLAEPLPGHPPWEAQADAAESRVALARGDKDAALELGRSALMKLHSANTEDWHFEILVPAARAVLAAGEPEEQAQVQGELLLDQALTASRIMDDQVRVRWFHGPVGSELTELAGPIEAAGKGDAEDRHRDLGENERTLLHLLVQGKSNSEIGRELGVDETAVSSMLSALYARIGTSSRAETTAFAFRAV